jgi:hypothetical protein
VFTTTPGGGPIQGLISGGRVADWAFKDGKLYGGNAETGQLAVITPNVGRNAADPRPVFQNFNFDGPGLDITIAGEADAYGAAWFIDEILYLYRNGGNNNGTPKVFKIDLQLDASGDPNPKIIEIVENVYQVNRNDGASFMAQGSELFVCTDTAYLVQGPANGTTTLSFIDQSAMDFDVVDIADTGVDEINAIGYNDQDNYLYGVQIQLDPVNTFPWANSGIVRIDANGAVSAPKIPTGAIAWPTNIGFNAGDVKPGTNIMYVHLNGGSNGSPDAVRSLYIIDLTDWDTTGPTFTVQPYSGPSGAPANVLLDWAAHPDPSVPMLFGADRQGQIGMLDTTTGIRVDTTPQAGPDGGLASNLPGSDGYGAAWFNSAGELFVYQNSGTIYKIDLGNDPSDSSDWTVVSMQSGDPTTRNDGAACAVVEPAPAIEIQKTVYWGHDSGASAASAGELVISENGDPVTYVFNVTNTGNTYLGSIMIDDALLGIVDSSGLTLLSGSEPLAPGESLVFYYETTINGDVTNTATASGNPVDDQGEDIPDLPDPTDDDTAEVQEAASGIDIQKTVYAGHDSGGSAPGDELVIGADGSAVTYVFTVTNTGETYLDEITIDDAQLGISRTNLTLLSGTEPLAPFATLVFYHEGLISGDLVNTASTSGNPVDDQGADLPGFDNPEDSDNAEVKKAEPAIQIQKTVYAGHDFGASAPGEELVTAMNGDPVTYVFTVTNTGNTDLDEITIDDAVLGISRLDLDWLSGSEPLAPGDSLVFYYETTISGDLTNTASTSGNPVDDQGADIPGLADPTDDDTARVEILTAQVSVLKLTDGAVDPTKAWTFSLFNGPNDGNGNGFLASPLASASTFGDADGVLDFGNYALDISMAYTLCEMGSGAGFSSEWMIDTGDDGNAETIIMPYNPNVSDNPAEDMGIRCFDFGAGTSYELIADSVLVFEVDNISPPGGDARTPGYWKNWNICSDNGNQVATAEKNGYYLLDDILTSPGVSWGTFEILSCEDGVSILDQRELERGKKKSSDAAYTLAMHLLAYQLNEAALIDIGFDGTGNYLRPKNPKYQTALDLAATLDAYNNNMLCN